MRMSSPTGGSVEDRIISCLWVVLFSLLLFGAVWNITTGNVMFTLVFAASLIIMFALCFYYAYYL